MTLQERILEALGDKHLTQRGLYDAMRGEDLGAVDAGLNALLKAGKVTRELGFLQCMNGNHHEPSPISTSVAPIPTATEPPKPRELTKREREVYDLAAKGLRRAEIAERLNITAAVVSAYLSNARSKLGIARLAALPSPEGAGVTTVGATPPIEIGKINISALRRITFSPDLIARLVEQQRRTAQELQALLNQVGTKRQELADIEEIVRVATAREGC